MSFIAEYSLSNPILRETRRTVPDVEIEVEDEQAVTAGPPRLVFWARGSEADLDAFFSELPADPSITDFEILSTVPERRLFRVKLSSDGERGATYLDAIDHGITFLDITAMGDTENYRAHVPTRDALVSYRDACLDRNLGFELHRLYRSDGGGTAGYGLTDRQRDVLLRAKERGYFEVPRGVSIAELAEEYDVSGQAISALLRRGQAVLLEHTLAREGE